jgi:hypothetical protein
VRRGLLVLLVGSIVVNAALGIFALVGGDFGDLEHDVLFTSLCVSGAGVLALASLPAAERGLLGPLPWVGAGAGAAGFGLLIVGIWADDPPEALQKTAGTLLMIAVGIAHAGLLSLLRLAPRFRWALTGAVTLALVLGLLGVALVWGELDEDWFARVFGVVAVLLAAFTLLVPVLGRASRRQLALGAGDGALRFCPGCGRPLEATAGKPATCATCGLRFTVQLASDTSSNRLALARPDARTPAARRLGR